MNKRSKYKSGQRPTFRIWDNEKKDWFKPTYEGWDGKIEELHLSPSGDLTMRTFTDFIHESVFPDRFEIVLDESPITDEQAWNKIAEAYPETVQSLRSTLDHAVYGTSRTLKRLQELESDWSQIFDSEKSFDEWVEDKIYGSKNEQQKVKVKPFVIELMNEYRMKHPDMTFYGFIKQCSVEGFGNVESQENKLVAWLTKDPGNESILMKVWLDGNCCEVEEEPRWTVKVKDCYLMHLEYPFDDMTLSDVVSFTTDSKEEADAVSLLAKGTVEKV